MKDLWVSCNWATGFVKIDDKGVIIETAPIFKKFIGQSIESLTTWLKKKSKVEIVDLVNKRKK